MLTHCEFVCAGDSAKFQMSFIRLASVPELGRYTTFTEFIMLPRN
jgi:enoyl-CoA hydratase/carnithine racemase